MHRPPPAVPDHVKFNFPGAWALGMLAWGVVEFRQGYVTSGQLPAALDSIRWGADFFMRCHINNSAIIAQVSYCTCCHAFVHEARLLRLLYI
jgi:endoglucanase